MGSAANGAVIDSNGNSAQLHDFLGGKPTVLSFIFTTCDDVNGCPLATYVMRSVQDALQADPVIIEDDCFIGARSEVVEGVVVEQGAVLSMGVFIGASTKIVDRVTGEVHMGRVPAYSVVVPGSLPGKPLADGTPGPSLSCAVIIKKVDEKTRSKTSVNELLRD